MSTARELASRTLSAAWPAEPSAAAVVERYLAVRAATESLCEGMAVEDYVVQSMPDVSPTKWHLAHTSWFFETFLLQPHHAGYQPLHAGYAFLFNSYYVSAGERHCRAQRGYISRPTVAEVFEYRRHVDVHVQRLLERADPQEMASWAHVLELGLHHEQQHQELMVTDIKHVLAVNPLRPALRQAASAAPDVARGQQAAGQPALVPRAGSRWVEFEGGLARVGHEGPGFAFDNEGPAHLVYLQPFALADRPVTNADYLEFMEDGGYGRPELWLSLGWATREQQGWTEPFYWERRDGRWCSYTLHGLREIDPAEPAVHLSYFEADAFARWANARLPTEAEWETAARSVTVAGNFLDSGLLHPRVLGAALGSRVPEPAIGGSGVDAAGNRVERSPAAATEATALYQVFGDVWEWTRSPYEPYPGFRPAAGALGEYNGKFMCNQFVLRGGSCATPASHIRATYRNFFPPEATWQFTGLRLARDLS